MPSTNDPETRVRHRHAELTTIQPDSCTFTGHSSMDLIQLSNGVADLVIRQGAPAFNAIKASLEMVRVRAMV